MGIVVTSPVTVCCPQRKPNRHAGLRVVGDKNRGYGESVTQYPTLQQNSCWGQIVFPLDALTIVRK